MSYEEAMKQYELEKMRQWNPIGVGGSPTIQNAQALQASQQQMNYTPQIQGREGLFDQGLVTGADGRVISLGSRFGDYMNWGQSAFNIASGGYNIIDGKKKYKDKRGDVERNFQNQEDIISYNKEQAYLSSLASQGVDINKFRDSDSMKNWRVENKVGR